MARNLKKRNISSSICRRGNNVQIGRLISHPTTGEPCLEYVSRKSDNGATNERLLCTDPEAIAQASESGVVATTIESDADGSFSIGQDRLTITVPCSTAQIRHPDDERAKTGETIPAQLPSSKTLSDIAFKSNGGKRFSFSQSSNPYMLGAIRVVDYSISRIKDQDGLHRLLREDYVIEFTQTFQPTSSGTSDYLPKWRKPKAKSGNREILPDSPNDARRFGPNDCTMAGSGNLIDLRPIGLSGNYRSERSSAHTGNISMR